MGVIGDIMRETVEARVVGFVYNAHAATPELLDDPAVRNSLADERVNRQVFSRLLKVV